MKTTRPQHDCCGHASDCAVHNAPALPVGPCDCGFEQARHPRLCPFCKQQPHVSEPEYFGKDFYHRQSYYSATIKCGCDAHPEITLTGKTAEEAVLAVIEAWDGREPEKMVSKEMAQKLFSALDDLSPYCKPKYGMPDGACEAMENVLKEYRDGLAKT